MESKNKKILPINKKTTKQELFEKALIRKKEKTGIDMYKRICGNPIERNIEKQKQLKNYKKWWEENKEGEEY